MPCFYAPQLDQGIKSICIEGEEFHHIVNVFRKRENDQISLTNGKGQMFEAVIEHISKKNLCLKTLSSYGREKSRPDIAVGFSLLRNKSDHIVIEKLTELGVSRFYPFESERTVRTASTNTVDKFVKTAISAMKQCDNPFLPQVNSVKDLKQTLQVLQQDRYTVFAALERDACKLISDCIQGFCPEKIALIFGPEGGFTDNELSIFNEMSIKGFSIGNHILRAETAAIAGVSQLLLTILQNRRDFF